MSGAIYGLIIDTCVFFYRSFTNFHMGVGKNKQGRLIINKNVFIFKVIYWNSHFVCVCKMRYVCMVNQNNFTHARESKIYNFLKIKIVFLYVTVETAETASGSVKMREFELR